MGRFENLSRSVIFFPVPAQSPARHLLMAIHAGSACCLCSVADCGGFLQPQSLWFYTLMNDKDGGFLYPTQQDSGFSKDWDIVRWVIAALPLIGVPIGALHACYSACGSGSPVCTLENVCVCVWEGGSQVHASENVCVCVCV